MLARFPRRPSITLVGAVALVLAIASPAGAVPGDLDPTFDGDGKVTTAFGALDEALGVAIQGDGKIVAVGAVASGNGDFALARYNTDGSLDTTFSADGKATTDFAGGNDRAYAVAIQADGKILTAGVASVAGDNDFALARYNTDGSLDTTFTGDGKTNTDIFGTTDDAARAVAIQGDGKIVAAGRSIVLPDSDFVVVRYQPNGTLDTTFGVAGTAASDFAGGDDEAFAVAIQADGKIVAAGSTRLSGTFDFALARYNTDGNLDSTFSADGKATTDFAGGTEAAFAVAIQGDGKIVAAGYAVLSGTFDFALARYNTDGNLDSTFSADGKVNTDFAGGNDPAFAVAIQGNGKIVAAGSAEVSSGVLDFALARYNTDGSLDTTFSADGKATTDFGGETDQALAVAIQGDGKIVAAGYAVLSGNADFALARYQGDPSGGGPGGPGGPGGGGPGGGPPTCAGRPATIIGTQAGDTLTGTPQKDVIAGLGGNDVLRALGGNDRICGGAGKDRMFGGRGSDRLIGNAGADRLAGGPGGDNLNGGKGRDRCNGGPGTDKLRSCEIVAG